MKYKDTIEVEVEFNELDESKLIEYAVDELGLIDPDNISLEQMFTDYEIEAQLKKFGGIMLGNISIRHLDAYQKLIENVDKVPIEEIENLISKYNLL